MRWTSGRRRVSRAPVREEDDTPGTRHASLRPTSSPRYGVEIRGACVHAEADNLTQVLEALSNGHTGLRRIYVIDRWNKVIAFQGTPEEVRRAIIAGVGITRQESINVRQLPKHELLRDPGLYAS